MDLKIVDWLTLFALLAGPVSAVLITRWLDDRRMRAGRRMDIFRTLMRTRRTPITVEHVSALNLIEIEFAGDVDVKTKWSAYYQHLAVDQPRWSVENVDATTTPDEAQNRDKAYNDRIFKERQSLLAKLLHAMARALGFRIEQLDIFEGGYVPQHWLNVDAELGIIRRFAVEMFLGKKTFPISVTDDRQAPTSTRVNDPSQT